jgi:hypothetical protein
MLQFKMLDLVVILILVIVILMALGKIPLTVVSLL